MKSIFSPDSPVMRTLARLCDLMVLNFIFLLTSVPIFTIGASLTALYTVVFRIGTEQENGLLRPYFRAFRANFKQATVLWLILLLCGVCTFWDISLFTQLSGVLHYLYIPAAALFLVVLLIAGYAFPLLSQFNNTNARTLKNALLLSVGYLPRSIVIVLANAFPFLVLFYSLLLFLKSGFLWVFLYFSAAAYLNTFLLKKVFAPYREEEVK